MLSLSFNNEVLSVVNQEFINSNLKSEITKLLLKLSHPITIDIRILIEQIEAKKRSQKKLPTWFSTNNIYYPNKLNIEQTSSEITAAYKAGLISGNSLIDLTGGFGVDSFYFAKQVKNVIHCEINTQLSQIVKHNYTQLQAKNITCYPYDGLSILKQQKEVYDWIYIDPSRRDEAKGKVFLLKDCLPNVPEHLELFFNYAKNIMVKTSPLLDITSGLQELANVSAIYCVAVNSEVKELLWVLERDFIGETAIKTINILKDENQIFNYNITEESTASAVLSEPLAYLYEPNAAILKSGAFNILAQKLEIKKLQKHSHLYTSNLLINFPGRCFKILNYSLYNKKQISSAFKSKKVNVTTRNFPDTVIQIRKTFSLKDGGDTYLFFTTNLEDKKIVIETKKA
ncbi:THUMP-like domain-containing protein [Lacinutrix chionoecetis]